MGPAGESARATGADPRLYGRAQALQTLRDHLADTGTGGSSFVVIGGEAGAGKTALAETIGREAAEAGAAVLVARAYDVSFTTLYGAWIDLFAGYEQRDDQPPPPEPFVRRGALEPISNQPALLEQVQAFLAALTEIQPVVLLVDDLQWTDLSSCELLLHVVRHAPGRLMIMATVTDEALRDQPVRRLLPTMEREPSARRIGLPRLASDDLHDLVRAEHPGLRTADALRLVAYLADMTGGNALFAVELLRALEEQRVLRPRTLGDLGHVGVPLRLQQLVEDRLLRLSDASQHLLVGAAVIGPEVPFALWRDVVDRDEEELLRALEEAADARLVEPTRDGVAFRFVHTLAHAALYERIFPIRRAVMHRKVGDELAARPAPDPDAVARHFHSADDPRSGRWLVRAGARAEDAGALLTAVERYEAALRPLEHAGATAGERANVLLRCAVLRRMDDSWRAVAYVDTATQLAAEEGDPALSAQVLVGRGVVRCYAGLVEEGIADLTDGVAALAALPAGALDPRSQGPSLSMLLGRGSLVWWLAVSGRSEAAQACADPVDGVDAPIAVTPQTGTVAGSASGLAFTLAMQGRVGDAAAAYACAQGAYDALDQHRLSFVALRDELVHLVLPFHADEPDERERLVRSLRRMADQGAAARGFVDAIDNVRYPLLHLMALEGRWDEVHDVVDAMGDYGIPVIRHVVSSVRGPIARAQGDAELAWRLVRDTWPAGPSTRPGSVEYYHTLPQQRLAAELSLDDGDLVGAGAWLDAHGHWLDWSGFTVGRSELECLRARYEQIAGQPERARDHAGRAVERATSPRQPLGLLAARRALGEAERALGRHESARAQLDIAGEIAEAVGAPYERALVLLARAELALDAGDAATVDVALADARALCGPLDAVPALARADAIEARSRAHRPVVISYPAGLTEREAQVLGLLARGLRDKEIAALLHLSPRTVGRHVEKAYRKVGTHRRAEAAVFALRHGLVGDAGPAHGGPG